MLTDPNQRLAEPDKKKTKKKRSSKREPIVIGGVKVEAGTQATIDIELPRLYTHTEVEMPVHVIHGNKPGPRLFVSAALHGDEVCGIETVRRVLQLKLLKRLRGTLVAVPIVNVIGNIQRIRGLPDGRDLNRCFPGSPNGSLASRMAHQFMDVVVADSDYGIDLHTGSNHRSNLPQIRCDLEDEESQSLAVAFGAPVILGANLRDGSVRKAAVDSGVRMLLFEAGEALRFDEVSIRVGVRGIVAVMREIGMLPQKRSRTRRREPVIATHSGWMRAPGSGILRMRANLGDRVKKGEVIGMVSDPFGESEDEIRSSRAGLVIGRNELPLVHEGEAVAHVATIDDATEAGHVIGEFQDSFDPDEPHMFGGQEIER